MGNFILPKFKCPKCECHNQFLSLITERKQGKFSQLIFNGNKLLFVIFTFAISPL